MSQNEIQNVTQNDTQKDKQSETQNESQKDTQNIFQNNLQTNTQNNNQNNNEDEIQNEIKNDSEDSNDKQKQLNEMKVSLLNDFTKQKNLVINIVKIISIISSCIKDLIPTIENINSILPFLINELGISFCDLINETNMLKYYFNNFIYAKTEVAKQILISFIQVFNFESKEKTPLDILVPIISTYDQSYNELSINKRKNKTEIEEIYDEINSTYIKCKDEDKSNIKKNLLEKINKLEKKKTLSNSSIQYLREKIEAIDKNVKLIELNNENSENNENNNIFNDINYFINNIQLSNNIENLLFKNFNDFVAHETKSVERIPLKDREFLYKDEVLADEENEYTEFKYYSYPFSQEKIDELKRQYCGFLNSQGGRIYIGITDLRVVKGLILNYKQRDILKNELVNYTYDFYPKCRIDKINVYFIRIKSFHTKKFIKNLHVIKIIVWPGEPFNLYSLNNKGGYISTLRLPGQCLNLTAEEIHLEILKRAELLKQKHITEQSNNTNINTNNIINTNTNTNTNNNKTETKENSNEESNEENYEDITIDELAENEPEDKNNKKKVTYVVKITNIDTSLKIKDINRYFNGCGCFLQKFPSEEGRSKGFGEIHFSKKETAKYLIQKYNNINLCGAKKILMKLTKRVVKDE